MDDSIKFSRFCLILNIPALYRSCHLRDYFHYLVEREAFCCFHYKHRKQKLGVKHEDNAEELDVQRQPYQETRFVAIIAIKPKWFSTLIDRFDGRFWTQEGDDLPIKCYIRPLAVENDLSDSQLSSYCSKAGKYLTKRRGYSKTILKDSVGSGDIETQASNTCMSKLLTLQEFNPPKLMPAGNVGTPTKYFLEKIAACQLPHRIIKQLQLRFPRGTIRRLYSEVAFDYEQKNKQFNKPTASTLEGELIRTGRGQIISEYFAKLEPELMEKVDEEKLANQEEHSDDDDFNEEPEELDRGLKEPRFEEKIEVTWEKGGSGLVFHTDARFWREVNTSGNDFDALTADNLDIESRAEFQDRDNQELAQICEERHLRGECNNPHMVNCSAETATSFTHKSNTIPVNYNNNKINKKHKSASIAQEAFGQRILERFGWSQGQGLGSNNNGIVEPIEDSGKHPKDRRGFGYYGQQ